MSRPTEQLNTTATQQNGFSITKTCSPIDIPVFVQTSSDLHHRQMRPGSSIVPDGGSPDPSSNLVIINESNAKYLHPDASPPPTPPSRLFYINGNRPSVTTSLSHSTTSDTASRVDNRGDPSLTLPLQSNSKEAIRIVLGSIDAQINSVTEMLNYFTKLVRAEKAVQHALSELVPVSDQADGDTSVRLSGFQRLFQGSFRKKWPSTSCQLISPSTTDTELNKIMQNLVRSTTKQARVYTMRAFFHKVVTLSQLESLLACQQCVKKTYVDCENELESRVQQCAADVQRYERKYNRAADQYCHLRTRLVNICDKRASFARRNVETLMNNLTAVTQKLQSIHNDYILSLSAANHFQQWLHTQLRPCLLSGIERTMQLTCEVVRHLLVFGGEVTQDSSPSWLEELQADRNLSLLLKQCSVNFNSPVVYEFQAALAQRLPALNAHSTHTFIVNDVTSKRIDEIIRLYQTREVVHRDGVHQITMECAQWEEALAQWRAVFANPLPNPWANLPLSRSFRCESSASSVLNSSSNEDGTVDDLNGNSLPDFQDLWQDDRSRPVNLCLTSYRLTIYEFELRFAACLADLHTQIVSDLCQAQANQSNNLGPIPSTTASSIVSPLLSSQRFGSSSLSNSFNPSIPDRLDSQDRMVRSQTSQFSHSANQDTLLMIPPRPPSNTLSSAYSWNSKIPSPYLSTTPPPFGGNRLWNSVRYSVNKFRSHFSRSHRPSSSNGSGVVVMHSVAEPTQLPPASASSRSSLNSHQWDGRVVITHDPDHTSTNLESMTPTMRPSQSFPITTTTSSSDQHGVSTTDLPGYTISQNKNFTSSSPTVLRTDTVSTEGTPDINSINRAGHDSEATTSTIKRQSDINKEPWFHGVLPRAEVERLLQNQGDYLVRQTNKRSCAPDPAGRSGQSPHDYDDQFDVIVHMVLSVYWNGHKHFILGGGDGPAFNQGWHLEDRTHPTIRDLLDHHVTTQIPVTVKSGALLITPINRPDWQLDNADVQLVQKIGQGNFGEVYRGYYNGAEVAVKTCRADANASHIRQRFLRGERTALNLCHPHIVRMIGIAVRSYPVMIVMEYVAGGSLLNYLRKSQNALALQSLNLMCSDAASGMAYLELKNCIHRDLAARNCLITEAGRVKIADFGMSREDNVYELSDRLGQIPIKWTAPEALATGRYTIKCDVWSYGVLLWEIFSFGDIPYRTWSNPQTRQLVESGYRLTAPPTMPPAIRHQMFACWEADSEKRPSFAELSRALHISTPSIPRRVHSLRSLSTSRSLFPPPNTSTVGSPTLSHASIDVRDSRTRIS